MSMKEIGLKIQFYYPEGDDKQFQKQVPWTDDECVLICLDNCRNMAGMDKKQVERLIQERMELMNPGPKLKPGEYNNKKIKFKNKKLSYTNSKPSILKISSRRYNSEFKKKFKRRIF